MESASSELERKNIVPEALFDAFYEGVSEIPQNGDGIRFFMTRVLLEDTNIDWVKFETCVLSLTQNKFLIDKAAIQHEHKGIESESAKYRSRMDSLFTTYRTSIVDMLSVYLLDGRLNEVSFSVKNIGDFLRAPENKVEADELKKILKVITQSIKGYPIKEFLDGYRIRVAEKHKENIRLGVPIQERQQQRIWNKEFRNNFIEMLKPKLQEAFNGSLPTSLYKLLRVDY